MKPLSKSNTFPRAASRVATNAQGYRPRRSEQRGGSLTNNHTMKIALSILLGVNAVIGLLILVLNHQL
jgi:hypothetical protein